VRLLRVLRRRGSGGGAQHARLHMLRLLVHW
jgi:hypothetical protein